MDVCGKLHDSIALLPEKEPRVLRVGHRAGVDTVEEIKILYPPEIKHRPSNLLPIAIPTELSRLLPCKQSV
jgi:hypothetical protein